MTEKIPIGEPPEIQEGKSRQAVLEGLETDVLALMLIRIGEEIDNLKEDLDLSKYIIRKRMEDDGATRFIFDLNDHSSLVVELEYSYEYNTETLTELFDLDERLIDRLTKSGAYIPAHSKEIKVEQKFNGTRLKTLLKEGDKYREIIDKARERTTRLPKMTAKIQFGN